MLAMVLVRVWMCWKREVGRERSYLGLLGLSLGGLDGGGSWFLGSVACERNWMLVSKIGLVCIAYHAGYGSGENVSGGCLLLEPKSHDMMMSIDAVSSVFQKQ